MNAEAVEVMHALYAKAGFDHLHFPQVGPDQRGFIDFWQSTLSGLLQ